MLRSQPGKGSINFQRGFHPEMFSGSRPDLGSGAATAHPC